jgi:hypothetical protein
MLVLHERQLEIFSQVALKEFEDWMLANLMKFFPAQSERSGEEGVRALVRYGLERAKIYGITSGPDVCKYIHVMMVYGRDFDVDPSLTWATQALQTSTSASPSLRVERLYEEAIQHQQ